ncbi:MAG: prepilin peptidase [bacterium]
MNTIYLVFAIVLGLAVGSFLNVVIFRLPRGTMFRFRRSICPQCEKQLAWYHNLPLVSYLVLGGKCAFCKKTISWRYPLVELLNAGFYALALVYFGLGWTALAYAALGSALLAIFFIDLDHQIIPDSITLPGIVAGLGVSFLPDGIGIVQAGIGMLVGGGSLLLIALLGDWLFKKESMGGGDIKMAAMLGAFLGWQKVLLVFICSAAIGLVISVAIMVFSEELRRTRQIPFGPFLVLAAVLAIVCGDQIIGFYQVTILGLP